MAVKKKATSMAKKKIGGMTATVVGTDIKTGKKTTTKKNLTPISKSEFNGGNVFGPKQHPSVMKKTAKTITKKPLANKKSVASGVGAGIGKVVGKSAKKATSKKVTTTVTSKGIKGATPPKQKKVETTKKKWRATI